MYNVGLVVVDFLSRRFLWGGREEGSLPPKKEEEGEGSETDLSFTRFPQTTKSIFPSSSTTQVPMSLPFIDGKSSAEKSQKGFLIFLMGLFSFSLFLSLSDIGGLIIDSLGE